MRLNKPQRDALPDSDFAGPHRSFPVNDQAHAKAAIMLSGKAAPADRPRIVAKAERVLHGRAEGGMVETSDGVPEIDDGEPEDDISPVERAMHEHIYAKGHAAASIPHDKRMPEHWADIQRYHDTFGTDAKREPEIHKAKAHLDRLLAHREEPGEQEEPGESPAEERREEMQEGRKAGGMVGYKTGGMIAPAARKAAAILMLIHPGTPKAAGARR